MVQLLMNCFFLGIVFDAGVVHGISVLHPVSMNFTSLIGSKPQALIGSKPQALIGSKLQALIGSKLQALIGSKPQALIESSNYFTMTGDCDVVDDCVSSKNYPNLYGKKEECTVTMSKDALVTVGGTFNLENHYDHLMIRGIDIFLRLEVPSTFNQGESFSWSTDFSNNLQGWRFCFSTVTSTSTNCLGWVGDVSIKVGELFWVWASGDGSQASPDKYGNGWRYATVTEWNSRPDYSVFTKCSYPAFGGTECDISHAQENGGIGVCRDLQDCRNNPFSDLWLVHDICAATATSTTEWYCAVGALDASGNFKVMAATTDLEYAQSKLIQSEVDKGHSQAIFPMEGNTAGNVDTLEKSWATGGMYWWDTLDQNLMKTFCEKFSPECFSDDTCGFEQICQRNRCTNTFGTWDRG